MRYTLIEAGKTSDPERYGPDGAYYVTRGEDGKPLNGSVGPFIEPPADLAATWADVDEADEMHPFWEVYGGELRSVEA